MEYVIIYKADGIRRTVVQPKPSSQLVQKLQGEDFVRLDFDVIAPVSIQLNDYIEIFNRKFFLNTLPIVTKKAERLYTYECSFESYIYDLSKVACLDVDATGIHISHEFYLTGVLEDFIGMLKRNLERIYGSTAWNCINTYTGIHNETKTIGFSEDTCLSALRKICSEYEIEYDVVEQLSGGYDRTIFLRAVGGFENPSYQYGKGLGLTEVKRSNASSSNFITKLYAFGSSENIGNNYRNFSPRLRLPYLIWTKLGSVNEGWYPNIRVYGSCNTANVILQVPNGVGGWIDTGDPMIGSTFNSGTPLTYTTTGAVPLFRIKGWNVEGQFVFSDGSYIGAESPDFIQNDEAVAQFGVIEKSIIFDEVYPRAKSEVTAANVGGSVFKFADANSFNLYEKNALDEYIYLLPNTRAKIHFNSGNLAGYDFEVDGYNHYQHLFTLRKNTDERGQVFPSEASTAFQIQVGDDYVLLDVMLPFEYVRSAEEELLLKAQEWLDTYSNLSIAYQIKFDEMYLKSNGNWNFGIGSNITVIDPEASISTKCRIKEVTRNLQREYQFEVVLSEEAYKGRKRPPTAKSTGGSTLLKSEAFNDHEKQHSINSPLDHASADTKDYGGLVRANPVDGSIEFINPQTILSTQTYRHDQGIASEQWIINHNLGRIPSVTISDSAGTEYEAEIIHIDSNSLIINFSAPFQGYADLN